MDSLESAKQWQEIATIDLKLAEHTAKTMWPVPYSMICFHCQQSAEKYLKGYLVINGQEPPYIHDLIELRKRCEALDTSFAKLADACIDLTVYGVVPRYPTELHIEKEDMDRALKHAASLKQFVREIAPTMFQVPELERQVVIDNQQEPEQEQGQTMSGHGM